MQIVYPNIEKILSQAQFRRFVYARLCYGAYLTIISTYHTAFTRCGKEVVQGETLIDRPRFRSLKTTNTREPSPYV